MTVSLSRQVSSRRGSCCAQTDFSRTRCDAVLNRYASAQCCALPPILKLHQRSYFTERFASLVFPLLLSLMYSFTSKLEINNLNPKKETTVSVHRILAKPVLLVPLICRAYTSKVRRVKNFDKYKFF